RRPSDVPLLRRVAAFRRAIAGRGTRLAFIERRQFGILFARPVVAVAVRAVARRRDAAPGEGLAVRYDETDGRERGQHAFPAHLVLPIAFRQSTSERRKPSRCWPQK